MEADGLLDIDGLTLPLGLIEGDMEELGLIEGEAEGLWEGELDELGETESDTLPLGETDCDVEGLTDEDILELIDAEGDWLLLTLEDGETDGEGDGLVEALTLGEAEELGLPNAGEIPNTTPVFPALAVAADAHVLAAIKEPSESPEVTAIEKSVPVEVSTSITFVQSGLTSFDIAAAKVVKSFP
jgi:hypothetical protein